MSIASRIILAVTVASTVSRAAWANVASAATVRNNNAGPAAGNFGTATQRSLSRIPGTNSTDWDNAVVNSTMTVTLNQDLLAGTPHLVGINLINGATLEMTAGANLSVTEDKWSSGVVGLGATSNHERQRYGNRQWLLQRQRRYAPARPRSLPGHGHGVLTR